MSTSGSGSGSSNPSTHPSDDEWKEVTNTSSLPGIDVMKSSSAASVSSLEPSDTDVAKLSAMQNVFLFLKVHVDPLYQKPLSRKMMLEYISVALYDHDLNPTEIVDYIGQTPRNLPTGEELIKLRQFNRFRDSNGKHYGGKRPAALNLCEEVMNLCIDVYLDEVSQRPREEETKRIKDASASTKPTTTTTGKGKGKEVEIEFKPTEEFMKHATPSVPSTSYHPAKLQTCVPPLKRSDEKNPKPPTVIVPSTTPKTASAPNRTSQDLPTLLAKAKEIQAEAELVKKKLSKSTTAINEQLDHEIQAEAEPVKKQLNDSTAAINEHTVARKPHLLDNVGSHIQLPSTHPISKDENRTLYTRSKQGKSPFENHKIFNLSFTSSGLDDEPMKPLYSRSRAKETSLWKADMIYATHGLPTQKSFAQQISDRLDNPPYVDRASGASLWSKKNMAEFSRSALRADEPKPGDVIKNGELVGNAYDLNRHFDITEGAAATTARLAALPTRQKSERPTGGLKDGMAGEKTANIKSERRRIAEIAKATDAERETAEPLKFLISSQKFEKPSLLAPKVPGSKPSDVFKDGKLIGNNVDQNREAAIQKARDATDLTPTQRLEKPSLPAINIPGSKPGEVLENGRLVGKTVEPNRLAALQRRRERFAAFQRERDAALAALTPTQKFEMTLTDHATGKTLAGGDAVTPAGHPNSLLTAHDERTKHAPVPETAAKKDAARKAMDKVPGVKKEFKQGPVTPPTKSQFEKDECHHRIRYRSHQPKKEVKRATWTEKGDPAHLVKILMVPAGLLVFCTFIQIMMNLGTIMSTICNVVSPCLAPFMDCTRYFWFGVWWLITAPFLFFGYVGGLIRGLVNQGMDLRPGHAVAPSTASPIIIEPGPPTIPAMTETITLWEAMGKEKAKHLQCEDSLHISSEISADSPTGIRYESVHSFGNEGWMIYSAYPFTRHNNSMPEADRCEHFVKSFQHFWKEEMEEKKEEGKEGRFDLALGNELAEVLSRYCK